MNLEQVQRLLKPGLGDLVRELGIARMAVFGSVARAEAAGGSDVDVVVEFQGPADFNRFMELRERLEGILGRPVDLVTYKALRPAMRAVVERESVRVA